MFGYFVFMYFCLGMCLCAYLIMCTHSYIYIHACTYITPSCVCLCVRVHATVYFMCGYAYCICAVVGSIIEFYLNYWVCYISVCLLCHLCLVVWMKSGSLVTFLNQLIFPLVYVNALLNLKWLLFFSPFTLGYYWIIVCMCM